LAWFVIEAGHGFTTELVDLVSWRAVALFPRQFISCVSSGLAVTVSSCLLWLVFRCRFAVRS